MFPLGLMGAGDVKLVMALGAWGGLRFVLETSLLSILIGGVIAALILLRKGRLGAFIYKIRVFLASLGVRSWGVQVPSLDRQLKMPFGVPIALAATWIAWGRPLQWLGLSFFGGGT